MSDPETAGDLLRRIYDEEFGFLPTKETPIVIDTAVRTGGDYGVTASVSNIVQVAGLVSSDVTIWGVPTHTPPPYVPPTRPAAGSPTAAAAHPATQPVPTTLRTPAPATKAPAAPTLPPTKAPAVPATVPATRQ